MQPRYFATLPLALFAGPAMAQDPVFTISNAPLTGRESFLAVIIVAMMLCGLACFFLAGRVAERTRTAFAMFAVLIGGFGLLVLFGWLIYDHPIAAVGVVLLMIGLFKLMNQFEVHRKGSGLKSTDGP